jgi:hypothetical protein
MGCRARPGNGPWAEYSLERFTGSSATGSVLFLQLQIIRN